MRISHKLLVLGALAGAAAAAADQSLTDLIMPDARLVVSIDIARIRSSPLLPAFSSGLHDANPEIQKLMEAAGFDPLRDLEQVLLASPATGKNPPALVIARGTFDTTKLRAFAESAGSKITEWQGVPILSDPEKDSGAFALLDNMILGGNLDQVKAAIGRRGHGMVLNTEMAMRIAELSRRYDAWMVSIAPLATMTANLPPDAKVDIQGLGQLEILRSIEQLSLGVSMTSDLTVGVEVVANNGKAASSLGEGAQMLIAMAQKSAQDQPEAMAALKRLELGVEGNTVRLGFHAPIEEVQAAVQKAIRERMNAQQAKLAARRPAGPPVIADRAQPVVAQPVAEPEAAQAGAAASEPGVEQTASGATPAANATPVRTVPVAKSARIPRDAQLLIQSSPKDMGTVVIRGSKQ